MRDDTNRGGLSCKHDNERDCDQGVYASNRHAETNIGRQALGLELDPLAEHGTFPCDFPRPNISSGNRGIVPGKSTKVYLAD